MEEILSCERLCKRYDSITALNNVQLHLPKGRIIGLLGPNGSGKTTLMKILAGLLRPSLGIVRIDGMPIGVATKSIVSYLPDKMYYANWMKTKDLLDLFEDFYTDFSRDKAEQMCASLQIGMNTKIKTMSKGTKEKVQLILAMSRQAKLYLLDEPIAGVDPAARDYILSTILTNRAPDSTVLISTHLISDVEPVLHDAIFLKQGCVLCYDSVEHIREVEGKSVDEVFRELFRTIPYGGAWPC